MEYGIQFNSRRMVFSGKWNEIRKWTMRLKIIFKLKRYLSRVYFLTRRFSCIPMIIEVSFFFSTGIESYRFLQSFNHWIMKRRGGEANLNLLFAKCEFNEKRIFEIRPKLSLSKISMLDTSMTGKANYPFTYFARYLIRNC